MPNSHIVTNSISQQGNNHATQTITPDYTGIYFFCGTILLIAILTLCVIHKISEKWRIDNYKLRLEEIKQGHIDIKDLSQNLKKVKILLEGLNSDGNNTNINH